MSGLRVWVGCVSVGLSRSEGIMAGSVSGGLLVSQGGVRVNGGNGVGGNSDCGGGGNEGCGGTGYWYQWMCGW